MTDIIQIVSGEIVSSNAPEGRVEDFLRSLDVSEKSRATYTRSLRQFISWLAETGRNTLELQRRIFWSIRSIWLRVSQLTPLHFT